MRNTIESTISKANPPKKYIQKMTIKAVVAELNSRDRQ